MSKYFQELPSCMSLSIQLHMEAQNKIIAKNVQISLSNLNNSLYYIKRQIVEEMVDKNGF